MSGKKILDVTDVEMKRTLEVNTLAHLYTIREFMPAMIAANKGHIVSICSVAGLFPSAGLADYTASKFGAFAIDEALRLEIKKMNYNIQTTCICPYFINTGMFEGVKGRWPLRILDQHWVVWRIITAIRQNEKFVMMPFFFYLALVLRSIAPVPFGDILTHYMSGHSMDKFVGRRG